MRKVRSWVGTEMKRELNFTACGMGRVFGIWSNVRIRYLNRLYYIRGGNGYYTVGGVKRQFQTNHFYYLPWTVDYSLSQNAPDPLDHIFIDFTKSTHRSFRDIIDLTSLNDIHHLHIAAFLCSMTESLSEQYSSDFWLIPEHSLSYQAYKDMMESCMGALVFDLEQKYSQPVSCDNENIYLAVSYIHEHYMEDLNISTLAALACLNEKYFINKFKTIIGQTPYQYIQSVRYDMAMTLNAYGIPLNQAAEQVGFSSPSAVYRMRKKSAQSS